MADTKGRDCFSDSEEHQDNDFIPEFHQGTVRKNLFEDFALNSKRTDSQSGREFMKVFLRIRPLSSEEISSGEDQQCLVMENPSGVLTQAPKDSFTFKNSTRGVGEVNHRFTFSNVFPPETTQKTFFDETSLGMVKDFIEGQNCLLFTYGVTNSGKTYTIQGTPKDGGVLPRTLDVLFNSIEGKHYTRANLKPRYFCEVVRVNSTEEQVELSIKNALIQSLEKEVIDLDSLLSLERSADISKTSSIASEVSVQSLGDSQMKEDEENSVEFLEEESRIADDTSVDVDAQGPIKFSIWVSFAEIYNEVIYDLLEPCPTGKGKKRTALKIGDDKSGNPYIKGLREVCVASADEAYKILKVGQKNQKIATTKLNHCSSRSHCVFTVKVLRVMDVEDPHVARVSKLSFVDLAGSERYAKTNSKGARLKEAGNINTSLMTLGKCLDSLRYNQHHRSNPLIIPFRESKLTRLFQAFFCGQGRAAMIVNASMCASMFDETFHVMKFSAIAKQVTTRVKPAKLPPQSQPREPAKNHRDSVAWAQETLANRDVSDTYTQQLYELIKALQEQLIEEKRKFHRMEMDVRAEVCAEMAAQLVEIEETYNERVQEEVMAVEEKCDRRMSLLIKSVKKPRKRRAGDDDPMAGLNGDSEEVELLQRKLEDSRNELKSVREALGEGKDQISTLEEELKIKDARCSEKSKEVEQATLALNEASVKIQRLQDQLKTKDANLALCEQVTFELDEANVKVERLEEEVNVKGASLARLVAEKKDLQTADFALKEANAKVLRLEEELNVKDASLARLVAEKKELEAANFALKEAQHKMLRLAEDVNAKEASLARYSADVHELHTRLEVAQTLRAKDKQTEEVLEVKLKEAEAMIRELERQLQLKRECDERRGPEGKGERGSEELAPGGEKLKADVEELERQLEQSTKALDKKNAQLLARNASITRLEAQLGEKRELEEELTGVRDQLASLQNTMKQRNQQIDELETQLDATKAQYDAVNRQLKDAEMTKVNEAMETASRDKSKLVAQLARASDDLAHRTHNVEVLKEEVQARQKIADDFQEDIKKFEEIVSDRDSLLEEQGKALDDQHKEVRKLTRELGYRDQKITRLEGKVERLTLKQKELEKECADKAAELSKLPTSDDMLKEMREAYQASKAQNAVYQARLGVAHEQVEEQLKKKHDAEVQALRKELRTRDLQLQEKRQTRPQSSSLSDSSTDEQQRSKRKSSSDMTLLEIKAQLSASKKAKPESDEEFTPSSVAKARRVRSTKKSKVSSKKGRSVLASTREDENQPPVDVLSTMDNVSTGPVDCKTPVPKKPPRTAASNPPKSRRRLQKKEARVFDLVTSLDNTTEMSPDPATKIMTRQLRSRGTRRN